MDEEAYDLGGRSNKKKNILECTSTFLFTPPKCDMSKRFKLRLTNFIAAKTIGYSRIISIIFELLLSKIGMMKSILIPWSFSIILRKTMLHICCELLFVYCSVYDGKKKDKRHKQAIWDKNLHEILTRTKGFYRDAVYPQLASGVNQILV